VIIELRSNQCRQRPKRRRRRSGQKGWKSAVRATAKKAKKAKKPAAKKAAAKTSPAKKTVKKQKQGKNAPTKTSAKKAASKQATKAPTQKTTWKISPEISQSVVDVDIWKKGDLKIEHLTVYRSGWIIVDQLPDLSGYNPDEGVDIFEEFEFEEHQVLDGCAPCKGGAFQWVEAPPGNRSSRKQSEQSWR